MNFYFSDFSAFLQMGKHGFYVWLCYGVMLSILVLLVVNNYWQLKGLKKQFQQLQARKQQRTVHHAQSNQEPPL